MPTNEFLSYASGVSPNVTTQSDYAASGARTGGVVAGTADPMLANKAWRQGANMASAIGAVIVAAGLDALDDGDTTALFAKVQAALRAQIPNYVSAVGGTANALTITLSPAPANWAALVGVPLRLLIATTNTGAATLNPNGLGTKSIVRASGAALVAGDLPAGQIVTMVYNGTAISLVGMTNSSPGGSQTYSSAGSGTFTVPVGVYKVFAKVWGGGGGGGGANASSPTDMAAPGGAGGGYSEGWLNVTPGASISYTVGAGGSAGSYNGSTGLAGGNGGTSSFSTISATGGQGGQGASNNFPTPIAAPGVGSGGALNAAGVGGWVGFPTPAFNVGGMGGSAPYGGGITNGTVNAVGFPGQVPGGGGSGASVTASIGGAGAIGQIIVSW